MFHYRSESLTKNYIMPVNRVKSNTPVKGKITRDASPSLTSILINSIYKGESLQKEQRFLQRIETTRRIKEPYPLGCFHPLEMILGPQFIRNGEIIA